MLMVRVHSPQVSIVVPVYNAAQTLARCLDGLLAQTTTQDAEIIVVDDGSTDASREIAAARASLNTARSTRVRVLTQAHRGAAAARNLGAQHARGDIVLFIDADSVPDPRWVEALSAPFADPTLAGAGGEKKSRQQTLIARFIQMEYDYRYERVAAHAAIDFVDSSTAAYRRDLFLANDGFDETLMDAEDADLSFRLAERGYRLVLAREAIVYHTHPDSLAEFLRRKFRYALWRAIVYARHPRKAVFDTRTPQAQKLQVTLAFVLLPFVIGSTVVSACAWGVVLVSLLFVATTLPFVRWCWRRDPWVALTAPGILLLSAYAGGAGAAMGFLRFHTMRSK